MSVQYKKHIKRTQDRPGGIVDIEVRTVMYPTVLTFVSNSPQ